LLDGGWLLGELPWLVSFDALVEGRDGSRDVAGRFAAIEVGEGDGHGVGEVFGWAGALVRLGSRRVALAQCEHAVECVAEPVGESLVRPGDESVDGEVGVAEGVDVAGDPPAQCVPAVVLDERCRDRRVPEDFDSLAPSIVR
jgi:hypothetical protein